MTMKEREFCNVMEDFFFINDARQIRISYKEALAHCKWNASSTGVDNAPPPPPTAVASPSVVPLLKLAHIGAYYCLIQIVNDLNEGINKVIVDLREKHAESELKSSLGKRSFRNK